MTLALTGKKSAFMQWYEGVKTSGGLAHRVANHKQAFGQATRGTLEAGVLGGALGLASAELKGGLDQASGKAPVDGLMGALGFIGTVALAGSDSALKPTLDTMNKVGFGVLSYRKTEAFAAAHRGTGAQVIANKTAAIAAHGEDYSDLPGGSGTSLGADGADPLLAWASGKLK